MLCNLPVLLCASVFVCPNHTIVYTKDTHTHTPAISRLVTVSTQREMAVLEVGSEELCFSTELFTEKGFNVDEFVSSCRKRVTIERLRDDLERYFRALKAAMVDLINKDYADFVSLSSNLVRKPLIHTHTFTAINTCVNASSKCQV